MNALILSALSGVIMMFSGFALGRSAIRTLAQVLLFLIVVATALELRGVRFFPINTAGMLSFDNFALLFSLVATLCTWVFSLLSGRDMEKVGLNYSDYFALIFFILAGIVIASSFSLCYCFSRH
jgi:NADH-quinone oxidoreductase subunit N